MVVAPHLQVQTRAASSRARPSPRASSCDSRSLTRLEGCVGIIVVRRRQPSQTLGLLDIQRPLALPGLFISVNSRQLRPQPSCSASAVAKRLSHCFRTARASSTATARPRRRSRPLSYASMVTLSKSKAWRATFLSSLPSTKPLNLIAHSRRSASNASRSALIFESSASCSLRTLI